MKKIYKTALLALMSNFALAQCFIVPTDYRGAFAPSPTAMWTDTWANWDPQNTTYPSPTVTIATSISTNTTWTAGNTYLLQGQIYVKNGATLTIQPGTVILGDKASTGAGLFICQGAKLNAVGTAAQPIVFTSNQAAGSRGLGDWGGIILLGRGTTNLPGGIGNIEGLAPTADTQYGGGASPDDNDNSGTMQYVRIEFGGYVFQTDKEINGLTFGAVGRGTAIDHIQVSFTNDDSYEWFGGAVNCRYLVAYRGLDDDFDTDNGYSGKVQFCLSVRDPNICDLSSSSVSEGFESDNDASGSAATPQTAAIFSNMTLIGPYRGNTGSSVCANYRRAARLRRNTGLKIFNSIFMDHVRGVHIDGALCETNAGNGTLKFMNNIVAGNSNGKVCERNSGSTFNIWNWFSASMNDSLVSTAGILGTPYDFLNPDYRPAASSIALSGSGFTDATILAQSLVAPSVTSSLVYCQNDASSALSATVTCSNPLMWYTSSSGGSGSSTAPTPSTSAAGITSYFVSQMNYLGEESSRAQIDVTVNALPSTPVITPSGATSFCTGGSVDLTSNYTGGNEWSTTELTDAITVSSSGNYFVTYTDGNGCKATSPTTTVNVSSAPLPTLTIIGSATMCQGDTVILKSSSADTYLWANSSSVADSIIITSSGTYNVTTTNTNACNGVGQSADVVVTVNPVPVAAGGISSASGNILTFSNSSTGATSYNWDFGDGSGTSNATPTHAYASSGTFNVILTAFNSFGCSDTTLVQIIITGVEEIKSISSINLFPNPMNGQAKLELETSKRTDLKITMYDITGKEILVIANTEVASGKHNFNIDATEIPSGLYFTVIKTNDFNKIIKTVINK